MFRDRSITKAFRASRNSLLVLSALCQMLVVQTGVLAQGTTPHLFNVNGTSAYLKGDFARAEREFMSAYKKAEAAGESKEMAHALRGLVWVLQEQGKKDMWQAPLFRFITMKESLDTTDALSCFTNGSIALLDDQPEKAVENLDLAIKLNPKDGLGYYTRARAYDRLGNEELASKDMIMAGQLGYHDYPETTCEALLEASRID